MGLLGFNREVIKGSARGKVLWQPRIACWFDDKEFIKEPLPEPYTGLNRYDVYRKIGCSNRIYEFSAAMKPYFLDDRIKVYSEEYDETHFKIIHETPLGKLYSIIQTNNSNPGSYYSKWSVETEEELKIAIYIEEQTRYRFDKNTYDRLFESIGDLGLPVTIMPRASITSLFYEYMGVENSVYAICDFPDTVKEFCRVRQQSQDSYIDELIKSPFEWVNFGDNLHGGLLPPELYTKYIQPVYAHRTEMYRKNNIFTFAHWDGDVKSLLPFAKESTLDGIEAITPVPQGDVSLQETKKALGDMFLLDGIAALLFNNDYPLDMLKDQVQECIELFSPHLILGISDEMPSNGNIDRVKYVNDMVNEYNAK